VNVALLDPLAIVNGLTGLNVTVPVDELARVTVLDASVVLAFPYGSCRCTVMVPEATPAVVVTAVEVITSLLAAAGLTVSACVAEVMVVGEVLAAVRVGVPTCVSV
jgi:hypothetical protein